MKLTESLSYVCIFNTKEYKSLFKDEELKKKMYDIINEFPDQMKKNDVKIISVFVYLKHVEITFETSSSKDLTRFVSNLKSVSSRKFLKHIKSDREGIWTKNYLIATQEDQLDQKIELFLKPQEFKSIF